jgi:hypothetical protein
LVPDNVLLDIKRGGWKFVRVDFDGEEFLVFEAGQRCFRFNTHRKRLDREFKYLVADGDWRGLANTRVHTRFDFWQEDFALHQDQIKTRIGRG